MKQEENKKNETIDKSIPLYLQKDFGVELNYKLWSTKGSRFAASRRTQILNELSNKTIGLLSAYLIIVNLINRYSIPFLNQLDNNTIGFVSTSISILILIFSQFEFAKNYALKSEKYHQCSLEISELYNELRMIKSIKNSKEKDANVKLITNKYEKVLSKYENHLPIDFDMFRSEKPEYYKLTVLGKFGINLLFYFQARFIYHFFIFSPIILFIVFVLKI